MIIYEIISVKVRSEGQDAESTFHIVPQSFHSPINVLSAGMAFWVESQDEPRQPFQLTTTEFLIRVAGNSRPTCFAGAQQVVNFAHAN